jgi:hypothetical protein
MPIFPTIKLNIERWKYNSTFELYVSNMGHIKNKSRADVAPKIMQNGYVVIYVNGSNPHWMLLHRLVMLTWKPTPEAEDLTVDHLDHNKRNNALSNLEWVTREENERRAKADYIGNLTFQNGKTQSKTKPANPESARSKKKAKTNEYRNKMKGVKFFELNCTNLTTGLCKWAQASSILVANTPEGFKEFEKLISPNKTRDDVYHNFLDKFNAMLNGQNMTGHSQAYGATITPVFEESAVDNVKE